MGKKRVRWNAIGRGHMPLSKLAEQYFITCHTEGKTSSTIRGYQEKLGRFIHFRPEPLVDE